MRYILFILTIGTLVSCKTALTPAEIAKAEQVEKWIDSQNFRVELNFVNPIPSNELNQLANMGVIPPGDAASRINLIGRGDYIEIHGDSITTEMSYYGVRQMATVNTGRQSGIVIDGKLTDYTITRKPSKNRTDISFKTANDTEAFNFFINIFNNGKVTVNLNSTERNSIRYGGEVTAFQ